MDNYEKIREKLVGWTQEHKRVERTLQRAEAIMKKTTVPISLYEQQRTNKANYFDKVISVINSYFLTDFRRNFSEYDTPIDLEILISKICPSGNLDAELQKEVYRTIQMINGSRNCRFDYQNRYEVIRKNTLKIFAFGRNLYYAKNSLKKFFFLIYSLNNDNDISKIHELFKTFELKQNEEIVIEKYEIHSIKLFQNGNLIIKFANPVIVDRLIDILEKCKVVNTD